MDVTPFVTQVRLHLTAAAALGDEATRQVAEALAVAAEPAVRLAMLAAVGAVADEVTAALLDAPGAPTVAVRLDGQDIRVDVGVSDAEPEPAPVDVPDDDSTARISLRLAEALKEQIDAAARRDGVSVNTWLIQAATRGLARADRGPGRTSSGSAQRLTGWING